MTADAANITYLSTDILLTENKGLIYCISSWKWQNKNWFDRGCSVCGFKDIKTAAFKSKCKAGS